MFALVNDNNSSCYNDGKGLYFNYVSNFGGERAPNFMLAYMGPRRGGGINGPKCLSN